MIKVEYTLNYDYLSVKGHANFDIYGKDLICAGVSCITIGLCNHLLLTGENKDNIKMENGFIEIDLRERHTNNVFIEMAITQLKTIESNYSQYININVVDNLKV